MKRVAEKKRGKKRILGVWHLCRDFSIALSESSSNSISHSVPPTSDSFKFPRVPVDLMFTSDSSMEKGQGTIEKKKKRKIDATMWVGIHICILGRLDGVSHVGDWGVKKRKWTQLYIRIFISTVRWGWQI